MATRPGPAGGAPGPRDVLVERIRDVLVAHTDVREVRMFGGVSFMVDGRMAGAAGRDGDLLVRTDPAQRDALLERGGEPAFMGEHRPMGEGWMSVPAARLEDGEVLASWVEVGIESRNAAG